MSTLSLLVTVNTTSICVLLIIIANWFISDGLPEYSPYFAINGVYGGPGRPGFSELVFQSIVIKKDFG